MKFLTLNIRHGGGRRVPRIVDWLQAHEPDIAVMTEYRSNAAGSAFRDMLEAHGYVTAVATRNPAANGVLIASRLPMNDVRRVTPADAPNGELLLVEIGGMAIVGCYFPGGPRKAPFFERCNALARTSGIPMIVLGDLNTGCNVRDLAPGAARFDCSEMFLDLERDAGLVDLWRRQHGQDAREWSWLSRVANGYRLDHAFANIAFLERPGPVTAQYLHDSRASGLSDHSAMVVIAAHDRSRRSCDRHTTDRPASPDRHALRTTPERAGP